MGSKLETKNDQKAIKLDLENIEFDMVFTVREPYEGGPGEILVRKKECKFCRCFVECNLKQFFSIWVSFWVSILNHFFRF